MDAKLSKFFRVVFAIFMVAMLFTSMTVTPAAAQDNTPPNAWTAGVCSGEAAIVVQGRDEEGDGVTVAFNDPTECDETNENLGWFVVEPWDEDLDMNADAGCYLESWEEAGVFSQSTGYQNGSAWRIRVSDFAEHPLVVSCDDVNDGSDLGLNPNERQVELARQNWVVNRAIDLLKGHNMTPAQYCESYDEPLADYLCNAEGFTNGERRIVAGNNNSNGPSANNSTGGGSSGGFGSNVPWYEQEVNWDQPSTWPMWTRWLVLGLAAFLFGYALWSRWDNELVAAITLLTVVGIELATGWFPGPSILYLAAGLVLFLITLLDWASDVPGNVSDWWDETRAAGDARRAAREAERARREAERAARHAANNP